MTRELIIDVIVRDRKGGKVFRRKNGSLRRTLKDLDALVEEKYVQKDDVPPILGATPPAWMR
jgi:hypothetical protein